MDVFSLRNRLVGDYGDHFCSFIQTRDGRIRGHGGREYEPTGQVGADRVPHEAVDGPDLRRVATGDRQRPIPPARRDWLRADPQTAYGDSRTRGAL